MTLPARLLLLVLLAGCFAEPVLDKCGQPSDCAAGFYCESGYCFRSLSSEVGTGDSGVAMDDGESDSPGTVASCESPHAPVATLAWESTGLGGGESSIERLTVGVSDSLVILARENGEVHAHELHHGALAWKRTVAAPALS